jgi:H+/gluconate symporter-like permease
MAKKRNISVTVCVGAIILLVTRIVSYFFELATQPFWKNWRNDLFLSPDIVAIIALILAIWTLKDLQDDK